MVILDYMFKIFFMEFSKCCFSGQETKNNVLLHCISNNIWDRPFNIRDVRKAGGLINIIGQ